MVEGQRLFDLAQLDLWASLARALDPGLDRASLTTKVRLSSGRFKGGHIFS